MERSKAKWSEPLSDHGEKAEGLIYHAQAALNPQLDSCVYSAAYTTALGVPKWSPIQLLTKLNIA